MAGELMVGGVAKSDTVSRMNVVSVEVIFTSVDLKVDEV